MVFCFYKWFSKFYFKLPMNNFPSAQVKAKNCPSVGSYMPVQWVFGGPGKAGGTGQSSPSGVPSLSPGSTMA